MGDRVTDEVQAEDREVRVFPEIARIDLRFEGAPIWVRFDAALTAHRGKLLTGASAGDPVLAGAFLRRREIVLDSELLNNARERARILTHELFHFVWLRLSNSDRSSWGALLEAELCGRARGELGWSSEWRKRKLGNNPRLRRDYVCESFADTAAWMYAGLKDHEEFTLARRWRLTRRAWFDAEIGRRSRVAI